MFHRPFAKNPLMSSRFWPTLTSHCFLAEEKPSFAFQPEAPMPHPSMHPQPSSRLLRYAGDRLRFTLTHPVPGQTGWNAFLRTNLTRAEEAYAEVIALSGARSSESHTFAGASWRDIPLVPSPEGWALDLPLIQVGYFRAKAYCVAPDGTQHWPEGSDLGLAVNPDHLRTGNTLYCTFPRWFGGGLSAACTRNPPLEEQLKALDQQGYTVIPPSGTLRELTRHVPHILGTLGCRILHLLPLGPTPTTYARMGRFGSPYAQLDLTAIDPAMVEFDKRTTAVDQFRELAYAVHLRGGLVFLDIVINHTGWGSRLMNGCPDWFKRNPDGTFQSPGAWGVTWGDLVELDNQFPALWETIAEALLTWCRRGIDGFRCDAGYMVPVPAWQYIVARVRQEYPDCVFLLEGLGGAWEATEALLTEGGMQWAYSELFQNYSPQQVSGYLDHAIRQGGRVGPLVHYSETHDNDRLAKRGATWSRLRNRLCALTSQCGGFGFTSGVEWLAPEKVDVHQARGLNWGAEPNLIPELARLNRLLKDHPCFYDGATLERLSSPESPILALRRLSQDGLDQCLVLINLDTESPQSWQADHELWIRLGQPSVDLLEQEMPPIAIEPWGRTLTLEPAGSFCLAPGHAPAGLAGDLYRTRRAQAFWAYRQLAQVLADEEMGPADPCLLGLRAGQDPVGFLDSLGNLDPSLAQRDLLKALDQARSCSGYSKVITWTVQDARRVVPLPPAHWLLVHDPNPFEVTLHRPGLPLLHLRSVPSLQGHMAAIYPSKLALAKGLSQEAEVVLDPFSEAGRQTRGTLRLLAPAPENPRHALEGLALLTNGRGGMARLHADLGRITSKYDCVLGANLHPDRPCDRHIFAKRLRAWVNADGFLTALDGSNLVHFEAGPPAKWIFVANAGDGRTVEIRLTVDMLPDGNTTLLRFHRPESAPRLGEDLPDDRRVELSLRPDLEDRGFHEETHRSPGADHHFCTHTQILPDRIGFSFTPAQDRAFRCWTDQGLYHPAPEWSCGIHHPVESSRGLTDQGDAWSPGWFQVPLDRDASVHMVLCADPQDPPKTLVTNLFKERPQNRTPQLRTLPRQDTFGRQLLTASGAFLAHRGKGATVIAGYPWFLDWGRDTFIASRGLLAAGFQEEVHRLLLTFAQYEERGTLPNMLSADSTSDRDTSDAPLWFGLVVEEAAGLMGAGLYQEALGGNRTLREILASIATHYLSGTPNGIRVDEDSGLVWSPPHFTWMDTNYPAGTPREGYPIEIQALWIRLLRQLARLEPSGPWGGLAQRASRSIEAFWDAERGCCHDLLAAPPGKPAALATPDGHIRPNQLFAITLGVFEGDRARTMVRTCARHLLIPGALRSLAPLPVDLPLPVHASDGRPLNDPMHPYWGRYEGDEDTRRKPAYHNGTAWVWLLPSFCEALALAWNLQPEAIAAAQAYLGSLDQVLKEGCLGQLPELLDGDSPHTQRGCDAQAWSVTEALRVWILLQGKQATARSVL